ncbi:MAG: ThiF family adenylyltransferase [Candidatus Kariarchaeaceae archaeon]|jgi:molybdopterin/thiamine biosynthesis adenylyltransferase
MKNFIEVPVAHRNLISNKILEASISIIGVGHLGSWVGKGLGMIGATEFYLYDFDSVEERNLSGTPFQQHSIGKPKVQALKDQMENDSHGKKFIRAISKKVTKSKDIVQDTEFYIVATDSIKSRLSIFQAISKKSDSGFIIDLRSRAKIAEIYTVPLDDPVANYWYKTNLQSKLNDPTPPIHCNEANIIQNSYLTASVAIQIISDVLDGIRDTRYFRLGIDNYFIQPIVIPLKTFEKGVKKKNGKRKIKKKRSIAKSKPICKYCQKRHRKASQEQICLDKMKNKQNEGLPDRSALFRK